MNKLLVYSTVLLLLVLNASAQKKGAKETKPVIIETNINGKGVEFEIEFQKGPEIYYPLMAVWMEDVKGNYIQTLYVAQSIAKGVFKYGQVKDKRWVRGSKRRAAALPYWGHKRGVKAEDGFYLPTPENPVSDAYTGATPTDDFILKSRSDARIPDKFRILFEINQSWDWNEYWTNNKFPNDEQYKSSAQPALVYRAEIDINSEINEYELKAIGHSHYSGKDGKLYKDLRTITTAMEIVERIIVKIKK